MIVTTHPRLPTDEKFNVIIESARNTGSDRCAAKRSLSGFCFTFLHHSPTPAIYAMDKVTDCRLTDGAMNGVEGSVLLYYILYRNL